MRKTVLYLCGQNISRFKTRQFLISYTDYYSTEWFELRILVLTHKYFGTKNSGLY